MNQQTSIHAPTRLRGSIARTEYEPDKDERHFLKKNRWVIVYSPDPIMQGRWLAEDCAVLELAKGFYDDGTIIMNPSTREVFTVFGNTRYFGEFPEVGKLPKIT